MTQEKHERVEIDVLALLQLWTKKSIYYLQYT